MKRPTEITALVEHFGHDSAVEDAANGWASYCPVSPDGNGRYCGTPMIITQLEDGGLQYELQCGHSQDEARAAPAPLSREVPGAVSLKAGGTVAPGTPHSSAESGNGHQPVLEEYAEAEIERLRGKGLA